MLTNPWPSSGGDVGVEAGTIVADFEAENTVGLPDPHRDRRRLTSVLAGVLQCFQHAEVHGSFHVGAVAADARRFDRGGDSGPCRCGQRLGQSPRRAAGEDPVRQRAQFGDRPLQVALDLVDHRQGVGRVVLDGVLGEAQLHRKGDKMLLGAIVEVAFQLAPLGVAGRHDASPRVLQLLVALLAPPGWPAGRRRAGVVQRQGDLTASSVSTWSSASVNASPSCGRVTAMTPSSSPP